MTHKIADGNIWNPKRKFYNKKRSKIRWQLIDVATRISYVYQETRRKENFQWRYCLFKNMKSSLETRSLHWISHNKLCNEFLYQGKKINYNFKRSRIIFGWRRACFLIIFSFYTATLTSNWFKNCLFCRRWPGILKTFPFVLYVPSCIPTNISDW